MYYHINEFIEDWNSEVAKTTKVYSMITEEAKAIVVNNHVRSLERLAFHIPQIIAQIGIQTGLLNITEPTEEPLPGSIAEIAGLYNQLHTLMAAAVSQQYTDAMVHNEVPLYRKTWKIGDVLSLLVQHEIHHRSQMTVLMRMVGLPVPNLYGPVLEDWEKLGLPIAL